MAAYIAPSGEPFCADCRYSLRGCARRGRCPECGGHYYLNLPVHQPGIRAALARWRRGPHLVLALPSLHTLAAALLILGSALITIAFAVLAIDALYKQLGLDSILHNLW